MAIARPTRTGVGVVLAAGRGTRVGRDGNKAYLSLAGRRMVSWSLHALAAVPELRRLLLVVRADEVDRARSVVDRENPGVPVEFVVGGDSRHQSELAALRHVADDIESGVVDTVLIHDAARPLAGTEMMRAALSVAREFGGAVPAVEEGDLVAVSPSGALARPGGAPAIVRVQTPQAFRAAELLRAYLAADAAGFEGTDTSSCVEEFSDMQVRTFAGHERNLKVTYAHDVFLAEKLLAMHDYRL